VSACGQRRWAVAAGRIPVRGCGEEPMFTPRNALRLLNTGEDAASVRVMVVYARHDPVGPFRLVVAPRRVRQVRVNDLIFPEAVRLEEGYGLWIESDRPVVVQFTAMDTRARANAATMAMAWPQRGPA
jgi:hypothetical protein